MLDPIPGRRHHGLLRLPLGLGGLQAIPLLRLGRDDVLELLVVLVEVIFFALLEVLIVGLLIVGLLSLEVLVIQLLIDPVVTASPQEPLDPGLHVLPVAGSLPVEQRQAVAVSPQRVGDATVGEATDPAALLGV